MSVNSLNTFLNVKDAHLRVVSGNVYATAMNIGGINVDVAHGLQSVTNQGNVTSNTLQFSNATTGFVTTANITVGRDLTVTGNALVSSNLTVTGNVTVSDDLTVTENLLVSNNLTVTKDVTVTGNTFYTNPMSISVDSNVVAEYTGPHERPLRKYPEVELDVNAMTSPGVGGYIVAHSGQYSTAYAGWTAFGEEFTTRNTESIGGAWIDGSPGSYAKETADAHNGVVGSVLTTVQNAGTLKLASNTPVGAWVSLELPTSIKLQRIEMRARLQHTSETDLNEVALQSFPREFGIWGYDGSSWVLLKSVTGHSASSAFGYTPTHVNATTAYNKYAIVVTRTNAVGGSNSDDRNFTSIGQLYFYGHEEGSGSLDTTLKSVYNVPATTGTQLEVYYDAKDLANGAVTSVTDLSPNTNGGTGTDVTVADGAFVFNGTSSLMEKTSLSIPGGDNPFTFSFWLKNDDFDSNQYILRLGDNTTLYQTIALYKNSSNQIIFASFTLDFPIDYTFTSGQWNHISLVYPGGGWKQSNLIAYIDGRPYTFGGNVSSGGLGGSLMSLATSLTLRLGGFAAGNAHLDGSIANFRLYSKALNAGQVQELYEYQKDYFLGSRSSVTLYKGRLGVGVAEPSGQLELAGDERLQEYPPGPMSGYETLIPGHGVFCAYDSSTVYSTAGWKAFPANSTGVLYWAAGSGLYSTTSGAAGGVYDTSAAEAKRLSTTTEFGEYLILELPYKIVLSRVFISARASHSYKAPSNFKIYGSNNSSDWYLLLTAVGATPSQSGGNYYPGESDSGTSTLSSDVTPYKYIAIVVSKTAGGSDIGDGTNSPGTIDAMMIDQIKYFGTPGPTTLDKGSLTLGRSLDVPRISRYDVDTETPRPEKLVVDFDTTVNSSPTDISGKGNHGTFYSTASYSAADKAFNTPNGTGILVRSSTLGSGAQPLTLCAWAKGLGDWNATANDTIIGVGPNSSSGHSSFQLCINTDAITLDMASASNFVEYPVTITNHRWYFIAMTYTGGDAFTNTRVYVDGVEISKPASWTNGSSGTLSLPSSPDIGVGTRAGNGSGNSPAGYLAGMVSNPKIYNVALEPSEVQKLYRLGRTGRSMVISDTAVGIGKVPEAQLDVRGVTRVENLIYGFIGHRLVDEAELYYDPTRAECQDGASFASGTSINDIKGNHPGTLSGMTRYNYYWSSDASSSCVQTTGTVELRRDWTIMVWIGPSAADNLAVWRILGHGSTGSNIGLHVQGADGSRIRYGMYGNDIDVGTLTGMSRKREWCCMTMSYFHNGGVAGGVDKKMYQNERLIGHQQGGIGDGNHFSGNVGGSAVSNGNQPYQSSPTSLRFGAGFGSGSNGQIYNQIGPCLMIPRYLSDGEVRSLYRHFAGTFSAQINVG